MGDRFDVRLEGHPIVRICFPEQVTKANIDDFLERFEVLRGRGAFGTLTYLDALEVTGVTAELRRYFAASVEAKVASGLELVGEAVVSTRRALRPIITGYGWLRSASRPMRAFKAEAEAEAWLRTLL
ncbi:MAG: hypothetical protein AAF447_02190 [Myxococcota bacterium]